MSRLECRIFFTDIHALLHPQKVRVAHVEVILLGGVDAGQRTDIVPRKAGHEVFAGPAVQSGAVGAKALLVAVIKQRDARPERDDRARKIGLKETLGGPRRVVDHAPLVVIVVEVQMRVAHLVPDRIKKIVTVHIRVQPGFEIAKVAIDLVLDRALKKVEIGAIIDPAIHGVIAINELVGLPVVIRSLAASNHRCGSLPRAVELAKNKEITLAQRSRMRFHSRTPPLKEITRHLHRGVHPDAVNVRGRNQRLRHRDDLILHARVRDANVVKAAVNLAKVVLPGVAIVAEIPVVMQVAIPKRARAGVNADKAIIAKHVAIGAAGIKGVIHRKVHIRLRRVAREQPVLPVVQAERRAIIRVTLKVVKVLEMIHNDIHDDIHPELMSLIHHGPKILERSESLVQQGEINLPVAVVGIVAVLKNGRNPDRLVAQRADVFQPVADSEKIPPVPCADIPQVVSRVGQLVVGRVAVVPPVCDKLVNGYLPPVVGRGKVGVSRPRAIILRRIRTGVHVDVVCAVLPGPGRSDG